jgi:hypothetical protein
LFLRSRETEAARVRRTGEALGVGARGEEGPGYDLSTSLAIDVRHRGGARISACRDVSAPREGARRTCLALVAFMASGAAALIPAAIAYAVAARRAR